MLRSLSPITYSFLAALFCLALLAGCGGLPIKPQVTLGVIDFPAGQVIENTTNGQKMRKIDSFEKASAKSVSAAVAFDGNRVPLANYDKAICLMPDWWNVEVNYIHSLERFIQNHCSQAGQ